MVGLTGSGPGIGHVHQRPRGLGQGLVVDRVGHCGGLLLVGLSKVIVGQQYSGPVICREGGEMEQSGDPAVNSESRQEREDISRSWR